MDVVKFLYRAACQLAAAYNCGRYVVVRDFYKQYVDDMEIDLRFDYVVKRWYIHVELDGVQIDKDCERI